MPDTLKLSKRRRVMAHVGLDFPFDGTVRSLVNPTNTMWCKLLYSDSRRISAPAPKVVPGIDIKTHKPQIQILLASHFE